MQVGKLVRSWFLIPLEKLACRVPQSQALVCPPTGHSLSLSPSLASRFPLGMVRTTLPPRWILARGWLSGRIGCPLIILDDMTTRLWLCCSIRVRFCMGRAALGLHDAKFAKFRGRGMNPPAASCANVSVP